MRHIQSRRAFIALCANAVLLLLILLAVVTRDGRSNALAQSQNPSSQTPGGVAVMPGQLSPNTWGCYVIDQGNLTLNVYQFSPGEHLLRLAAARDIQYDRRLQNFNTTPAPNEIRQMLERADERDRAAPTTNKSPEVGNP